MLKLMSQAHEISNMLTVLNIYVQNFLNVDTLLITLVSLNSKFVASRAII